MAANLYDRNRVLAAIAAHEGEDTQASFARTVGVRRDTFRSWLTKPEVAAAIEAWREKTYPPGERPRATDPRQSVYDPELILPIVEAHQGSASNAALGHELGVRAETVQLWMKKYPAFHAAVTAKRDKVDSLVEHAVIKRAVGMRVERITQQVDANGKVVGEQRTVEEIPPDISSAKFFLSHRRPEFWDKATKIEVAVSPQEQMRDAILGRLPEMLDLDDADWRDVSEEDDA